MSFVQIVGIVVLWIVVAMAIEKILPAIMEEYTKSKRPISVSSGLIGVFVVAIIFGVFSVL